MIEDPVTKSTQKKNRTRQYSEYKDNTTEPKNRNWKKRDPRRRESETTRHLNRVYVLVGSESENKTKNHITDRNKRRGSRLTEETLGVVGLVGGGLPSIHKVTTSPRRRGSGRLGRLLSEPSNRSKDTFVKKRIIHLDWILFVGSWVKRTEICHRDTDQLRCNETAIDHGGLENPVTTSSYTFSRQIEDIWLRQETIPLF